MCRVRAAVALWRRYLKAGHRRRVLKPLRILGNLASKVGQVLVLAGLDRSMGLVAAGCTKNPDHPKWENDAAPATR
jgi:hypothetical protein